MKKRLTLFIQSGLFLLLTTFLRAIGLRAATSIGAMIGALAHRLAKKANAKIDRDMRHALPDLTANDRRTATRNLWRNIGRHLGEAHHYDRIWKNIDAHLRIINPHHLTEAQAKYNHAICFSGHFSNIEFFAAAVQKLLGESVIIYHPAGNAFFERHMRRRRDPLMRHQIPAGRETRKLLELCRQQIPLVVLVDHGRTEGVKVDFFDRPVMAPPLPAKLAHNLESALVPMALRRIGTARNPSQFEVEFYPPFAPQADIAATTQAMYDFIAARIRERPHEWLWTYDRWRDSPPFTP